MRPHWLPLDCQFLPEHLAAKEMITPASWESGDISLHQAGEITTLMKTYVIQYTSAAALLQTIEAQSTVQRPGLLRAAQSKECRGGISHVFQDYTSTGQRRDPL